MKYTHIFWDWNGTLLDDVWLSVEVLSEMQEKRNLPKITAEIYKEKFAFPVIDFYTDIGFDFDKEDFQIVGAEFIDTYNSKREKCALFNGAKNLLAEIKQSEIKQSILSAYEINNLKSVVSNHDINHLFENVVGLDNIYAHSKVELGVNYFSDLKIKPSDLLFIGDTEHDAHVADALGCDCILLETGHSTKSRLEKTGHKVVKDVFSLKEFIF